MSIVTLDRVWHNRGQQSSLRMRGLNDRNRNSESSQAEVARLLKVDSTTSQTKTRHRLGGASFLFAIQHAMARLQARAQAPGWSGFLRVSRQLA